MEPYENLLNFEPVGAPRILRGPLSRNGWKRFSFNVFSGGTENVGRLDINLSQHRENATSLRLYLYDSLNHDRIKVFDAPVIHLPDTEEELFGRAKNYTERCYQKRDSVESIPLQVSAFNK